MSAVGSIRPTMPSPAAPDVISMRGADVFEAHHMRLRQQVDRAFAWLLLVEWCGVMLVAWILTPPAAGRWLGMPDLLVVAATLGALIALPAHVLARVRPGAASTRHAVATAQMLLGVLLIHVTGGRIETHFFIFGALSFLAAYRDWRVLLTASLVVGVDHVLRGLYLPQSVYGVAYASVWRTVEHGFWVAFEAGFLTFLCVQGLREMRVTAAQQAELEAKRHTEAECLAALEASRVKSEFLAGISHEIRTPMTAIQGYTDLLLDASLKPSDRLEYVMTIRRSSEHLLRLLNGLLDLSKIEAGKLTVERVACSPSQIVVDVASLMRVRATEKSLAFAVEFATAVPETITSDPTRLRQILLNLVGNAIKFTATGSVRIVVRCEPSESPSPRLVFEVADTGIGLTREQIDKLFGAYEQAEPSTARKFGGTGLGLSIALRLARLLGGDIRVESLAGRGSSFTLSVETGSLAGVQMLTNLREAGVALDAGNAGLAPASAPTILTTRVLLAEDGRDNQILVATHLRRAGAQVQIAENGRIALDLALAAERSGEPFDVILMDMQMPEMDGYAATSALRKNGYKGPIVALTAHAMEGDRAQCLGAGCNDYLTKPIDRPKLLATVARYARASVECCDTLLAALADDDAPTMKRLVHQLKGAAGGYGFPSITEQARSVEAAFAGGDRARVASEVQSLSALCYRASRGAVGGPAGSSRESAA